MLGKLSTKAIILTYHLTVNKVFKKVIHKRTFVRLNFSKFDKKQNNTSLFFKKVIHSHNFSVDNANSCAKTVDKNMGNAYNCIVFKRRTHR